jgi:hypothetical protein
MSRARSAELALCPRNLFGAAIAHVHTPAAKSSAAAGLLF